MPLLKSQDELAQSTIKLQPKRDSSIIQLILAYDLCGWRAGRIATELGMSESRISIIKGSPLYRSQRQRRWQELQSQVTGKKTDAIAAGDPVEIKIKELAMKAIDKKEELLEAESEFVQNAASSDILDRAGYRAEKQKVKASIELSEKTAARFERILKMPEESRARIEIEVEH